MESESSGPVNEAPASEAASNEQQQGEAQAIQEGVDNNSLPEDMLDKVYTVTIDGEPKQLTVREMAKLTSFEQASQKRFREASEMNKKLEAFVESAKQDPAKALQKLGYDPEQFASEFLKRRIEEMQLSPDQLKERQEKEEFQTQKKQWEEQVNHRIREEIDHEMTSAFQKTGLPKSPFLAARMAGLVAQSLEKAKNGQGEPLSYEQAAGKVKVWFQNATRESLSTLDPKGISEFLGPEIVKKLREGLVSQVSGAAPTANSVHRPSEKEKATTQSKTQKTFKHWKDYHSYIDSL